MIDGYLLEMFIAQRKVVKIGTRGICIELIPNRHNSGWKIKIGRAFVDMNVDDISVLDDESAFDLTFSVDGGRSYHSFADLREYEKVTPLFW